jgi:hypothetical protein
MAVAGSEDLPCFSGKPRQALNELNERFRTDLSFNASKYLCVCLHLTLLAACSSANIAIGYKPTLTSLFTTIQLWNWCTG